jgi:hypothetical protein
VKEAHKRSFKVVQQSNTCYILNDLIDYKSHWKNPLRHSKIGTGFQINKGKTFPTKKVVQISNIISVSVQEEPSQKRNALQTRK